MKAGKGMSSDFMMEIGVGSHARLMSEWAHYKSWAEDSADKVESTERTLEALRHGLRQVLGVPDGVRMTDAELMAQLGVELNEIDRDPVGVGRGPSSWTHSAVPGEQRTAWVGYSEQPDAEPSLIVGLPPEMAERVKSWPSFSIDVETLPGERVGDALARGLRSAPIVPVPAPPGMPIASYEDFPVRPPGESPWLVPPRDAPPAPDHRTDGVRYAMMLDRDAAKLADGPEVARCAEPVGSGFCGVQIIDGHCSEHGEVGPPTETMQAVEEPPAIDPAYVLGRVFVRGDTIPDDVLGLATRLGDVWTADAVNMGATQYWNDDADLWRSGADLLLMHGTLWELLNATSDADQDSGQVSGE